MKEESTTPAWFRNAFFIILVALFVGAGGILLALAWRLIRMILGY